MTINNLLKEKYPEILKSIKNESYILEYPEYDNFEEIIYENEVVGFISYVINERDEICINEFYIQPEFRGLNLGILKISEILKYPEEIRLRKPNKAMANFLVKYDLAIKLPNNTIWSYIKFYCSTNDIYTNSKIKHLYRKSPTTIIYKTDTYDLDYCCALFVDNLNIISKKHNMGIVAIPCKNDLKKYQLKDKLKNIDEKYLRNTILENSLELADYVAFENNWNIAINDDLNLNLIYNYDYEYEQLLDANGLSKEDGIKIQNIVLDDLKKDHIKIYSANKRLNYLINNTGTVSDSEDTVCPYCHGKTFNDNICRTCGEKLDITNYVNPHYTYFEELTPEELAYPCSIYVKQFWCDNLIEYDFLDFMKYYTKYETEYSLNEIYDKFLEDDINAEIKNNEDVYDAYDKYLITKISNNYLHNVKDTIVYLIQYAILISNKSHPREGENIIECSESSMDLFYFFEELVNNNDLNVDIQECLDIAFDTFKVLKFKNNEEEIRKEFPKYIV